MKSLLCAALLAIGVANATSLQREKRQSPITLRAKENDNVAELCKGRGDEFFRLSTDGDCKEVYRCTRAGLKRIQCPAGLAFDVIQQTCLWRRNVNSCDLKEKPKKVLPRLVTDEPICPVDQLACGNGDCIDKLLFCDGVPDCADESDENACEVGVDPNGAAVCNTANCTLDIGCFCSSDGTLIPNNLEPEQTPQMITITFHGSVNVDNIGIFQDIFRDDRQNPNGCTAKGTFYVSHKYTNYSAVQELSRKGHEIGVFSITNDDSPTYWSQGSYDTWRDEMAGAREIIEKYANISGVIGIRAPQLRVGGNTQFVMMEDQLFTYDSSITAPLGRVPIWPYTLDYRMPHKCLGTAQNCPSQKHKIWEMVINELDLREDRKTDERLPGCHLLSSCTSIRSGEDFAAVLRSNFERHYSTNRAPLGLHFTAGWLTSNKDFAIELNKFIDEMQAKNDVYFLSNRQVLSWMEEPTPSNDIRDFLQWKNDCDIKGQPYCSLPNACPLTTRELPGESFYLNTCMECPKNYPWLVDYTGDSFLI